jgi:hypothetical protein
MSNLDNANKKVDTKSKQIIASYYKLFNPSGSGCSKAD